MSVSDDTTPAERPEVIRATRARGASWGRHIFWVLVISTTLAIIALMGSWAFNAQRLSGAGGQSSTAADVQPAQPAAPPSPVGTVNPAAP